MHVSVFDEIRETRPSAEPLRSRVGGAARVAPLSRASVASVSAFFALVVGLTVASGLGAFPTSSLASSPARLAQGRAWLLLSNGLLAQRPVVLCLFALAVLGFATLAVCGSRVSLIAAIVGHVGSTLLAYALVGAVYLLDGGAVQALVGVPDYGVSAIQAAWIGALAATAWRRWGQSRRGRIAIVAACVAIGLFAWMVRSDVTLVDADHLFAFAIGVSFASTLRERVAVPLKLPAWLRRVFAGIHARVPVRVPGQVGFPTTSHSPQWDPVPGDEGAGSDSAAQAQPAPVLLSRA